MQADYGALNTDPCFKMSLFHKTQCLFPGQHQHKFISTGPSLFASLFLSSKVSAGAARGGLRDEGQPSGMGFQTLKG